MIRSACLLAFSVTLACAADKPLTLNSLAAPSVQELQHRALNNALQRPEFSRSGKFPVIVLPSAFQLLESSSCSIPLTEVPVDRSKKYSIHYAPVENGDKGISEPAGPVCK